MGRARRELTLADYVAIAISPVLIMTLVGSLVFFLLEVVYRGEHSTRIQWVLICFVGGMVLVARIGIEQGVEQAQLYGGVLLVVALLFTFRFLDAFTVAAGLLCLIAFCTWKLTWDCALVDDSEDASGEGLLRATGLEVEGAPGETAALEGSERAGAGGSTGSAALRSLVVETPAESKRPAKVQEELPGVRAPVPTVLVSGRGLAEEAERKAERAERSAARQKKAVKPHAPGVWVVYFSLAALPLFGLGQLLIPATQQGRRGYAFGLLVVYVASGLGLLLTTSFLGLRRYLRQRGVTMPGGVTRAWLLLGLAMAAGVLGLATLLPRPSGVYTFNDLIDRLDKQVAASNWAIFDGDAGEGEGAAGAVVGPDPAGQNPQKQNPPGQPQDEAPPPEGPAGNQAGDPTGQAPGGNQPGGQQPGGNPPGGNQPGAGEGGAKEGAQGQSTQGAQPAPPQGSSSPPDAPPGKTPNTDPAGQPDSPPQSPPDQAPAETNDPHRDSPEGIPQEESDAQDKEPQGAPQPANRAANQKPNPGTNQRPNPGQPGGAARPDPPRQPPANRPGNPPPPPRPDEAGRAGAQAPAPAPPPATPPSADPIKSALSQVAQFLGSLGGPLKWIIYGLLALLGLFLVFWKAGAILDFLARLWQAFLGLFGGKNAADRGPGTEAEAAEEPRRFADFPNPYTNGTARRMKLPQLLDYSFQALEAWARERRVPLRNGQTPLEFAQAVAARIPAVEPEVTRAAQWYAQVAYAKRVPAGDPHEVFEKLWRRLDDTSGT